MAKKPVFPLVIISQPADNWYKDEGGKSNVLQCTVQSPITLSEPVHLRCALYYESEVIVEDRQADILSLTAPRALVLPAGAGSTCDVEFRIEKVSRRKDGQRFKLLVEPEPADVARLKLPLVGVFSGPINVLSKRKTGERIISRRPTVRTSVDVAVPDDNTATLKLLHATLLQMQRTLDDVSKSTKKIERRVANVEAQLAGMPSSTLAQPPSLQLPFQLTPGIIGTYPSSSLDGGATSASGKSAEPRAPQDAHSARDSAAANASTERPGSVVGGAESAAGKAGAAQQVRAPLQFATNIFGSDSHAPPAAAELPATTPSLIPGLSHQVSNMAPDFLATLLPNVSVHNVTRIRSTDLAVDYALPNLIPPPASADAMPVSSPPFRSSTSLTRYLSRQTSHDMGAWIDHFLADPAPSAPAAGTSNAPGATSVKRAKLSVVEALGGDGSVNVGVFTDDPHLAAASTAASGQKRRSPEAQ